MSFAISGVNLELNHETCDRHEAGILRRSMHRKRGAPNSPRIVADAKETACTRVISSPYRITESAEILSRLNPLPNPALLGFQSVEIQASESSPSIRCAEAASWLRRSRFPCKGHASPARGECASQPAFTIGHRKDCGNVETTAGERSKGASPASPTTKSDSD